MSLPYYMPPVLPMNDYVFYRSPETTSKLVEQIHHQHNIPKTSYQNIHDMFRPPTQGYGQSLAPPPYLPRFQPLVPPPRLAYEGITSAFSHVPSMFYPNMSALPEYVPGLEPGQSYLSQLRLAAERLTAADAASKSTALPETRSFSDRVAAEKNETVIVITDEDESASRLQPASSLQSTTGLGYEIGLAKDPSLGQQTVFGGDYKPGRGQEYISKIRALVEGIPAYEPTAVKQKRSRSRTKSRSNTPENSTTTKSSTGKRKRKNSGSTEPESLTKHFFSHWYPKPVSPDCDHLFLGPNGTFVPTIFYATIPWDSCEESTRLLMEYCFDNSSLSTRNLEGDYPLDPAIIDDIVTHVSDKCFVAKETVKCKIRRLCADTAMKCQRLNGGCM